MYYNSCLTFNWCLLTRSPDGVTKGVGGATVAQESPTCLFIQTELCREQTLHHWLRENIENRLRKTVFNYFNQVGDNLYVVCCLNLVSIGLPCSLICVLANKQQSGKN